MDGSGGRSRVGVTAPIQLRPGRRASLVSHLRSRARRHVTFDADHGFGHRPVDQAILQGPRMQPSVPISGPAISMKIDTYAYALRSRGLFSSVACRPQ
jgi:hypothetical protein